MYSRIFAGASTCSACVVGSFSAAGSATCEIEDSELLVNISLPLSISAFTPNLQSAFRLCISRAGHIPASEVTVINFMQTRTLKPIPSRRLLESGLQVNTQIKTVKALFLGSMIGISNKTALDILLVQSGLPASTAVAVQLSCTAGSFSELGQSSTICKECDAGTYTSEVGVVTSCQLCPAGKYATGSGATTCLSSSNSAPTTSTPSGNCQPDDKMHVPRMPVR